MNYPNIIAAFLSECWAIQESKLQAICEVLRIRAAGGRVSAEDIEAVKNEAAARKKNYAVSGSVAVIPVRGTICQHADIMSEMSGGTSTDGLGAQIDAALGDSTIGAVVLAVDSPGGSVYGVQELSDKIHVSRGTKPIVAAVDSLCASAAFWIASAADEIVITPGGEIGSVGVLAVHQEASKFEETVGLKTTIIKSKNAQFKSEANPHEPLAPEALANIQSRVNDYEDAFISALARNRGTSQKAVRENFGQGRVVGATEAVNMGMADRVATMESLLADMTRKAGAKARAAAHDKGWAKKLAERSALTSA